MDGSIPDGWQMSKCEFAAVGDNCIDRFLLPVDDCLVGGNAVNVAVQLAMLQRQVGYFGAIGEDAAGLAVRQALAARGVRLDHLRVLKGSPTAYTDIEVTADGDRAFVFEEFGACAAYVPSPDDFAALRQVRHVHIGWLNDGGALKTALGGSGVTLSQDLTVNNTPGNLEPGGLDIAFCSAAPEAAEAEAARLIAAGSRLAVVTLGPAGSLVSDGRTRLAASAPPITPEDTTGAGDAFIAGFLHAWVDGASLQQALTVATERGALACMHRGGFPQSALKGILVPWNRPAVTEK